MATFRKRNGKWQVQVRRKDAPVMSKSFAKHSDAKMWASVTEFQEVDIQPTSAEVSLNYYTVKDLLRR